MIPILFKSDEMDINTNKGIVGRLTEILSCEVHEEINGDYSCTFTYPVTGALIEELYNGGTIFCHVPLYDQLPTYKSTGWFDIYKHSIPINGVVTFEANHISRRLADKVYVAPTIDSLHPDYVLGAGNYYPTGNFNGVTAQVSGLSSPHLTASVEPKSILSTLIGTEGSFVSEFGGEFEIWSEHDGSISAVWVNKRGRPVTQTSVRYGWNMLDLDKTVDRSGTYNAVIPYWSSDTGKVFVSGYIVQPTTPITPVVAVPLDCTNEFGTPPTGAQLEAYARNFLDEKMPWMPDDTLTVDFLNGQDQIAISTTQEQLFIGDTIKVYWGDAGVSTDMRIVSYDFDVLAERYSKLELGTQPSEYVAVTGEDTDSKVELWRYVGGSSGSTLTPWPSDDWTEAYIEAYFPLNQQICFAWQRPRSTIPAPGGQGGILGAGYSASDTHACLVYCDTSGVKMYGYWRNNTSYTANYKVWVR